MEINKNKRKENILIKIRDNEDGLSGCLIFLIIVFVVLAAGAGYIYFQWSDIQKLGSEKIQKALKKVEENEEIESIEDIEDLEDIDLEELEEINPLVKRIVKFIPLGLIGDYQEITSDGEDSSTEDKVTGEEEKTTEEHKLEKTPGELLPDSIEIHPAMTIVDYQDLDEIPETIINKANIEEEFINNQSIFLDFEVDLPEREIAQLKEMEEVPEDITEDMIEDRKDELEKFYNTKEVLSWYEKHLLEKNWEAIKGKEIEGFNFMFQHEKDGYFITQLSELNFKFHLMI